jgi:hypothetical protein
MSKSIRGTTKKRRGRPVTTGKGAQIGMRWQDALLSEIDRWRETHGAGSRPEAIRQLVERGLKAPKMDAARQMLARGEDPTMPAPRRKK